MCLKNIVIRYINVFYLTFTEHINVIYNKSLRVLGFLRRNCYEFNGPTCLRVLYFSWVKLILEYGSLIWNIYQEYLPVKLERLQNRFLRMLGYKINNVNLLLNSRVTKLKMESSEFRRKCIDFRFVYNLLYAKMDCLEILALYLFI